MMMNLLLLLVGVLLICFISNNNLILVLLKFLFMKYLLVKIQMFLSFRKMLSESLRLMFICVLIIQIFQKLSMFHIVKRVTVTYITFQTPTILSVGNQSVHQVGTPIIDIQGLKYIFIMHLGFSLKEKLEQPFVFKQVNISLKKKKVLYVFMLPKV